MITHYLVFECFPGQTGDEERFIWAFETEDAAMNLIKCILHNDPQHHAFAIYREDKDSDWKILSRTQSRFLCDG